MNASLISWKLQYKAKCWSERRYGGRGAETLKEKGLKKRKVGERSRVGEQDKTLGEGNKEGDSSAQKHGQRISLKGHRGKRLH